MAALFVLYVLTGNAAKKDKSVTKEKCVTTWLRRWWMLLFACSAVRSRRKGASDEVRKHDRGEETGKQLLKREHNANCKNG